MSRLATLKAADSLGDIANILGFKPAGLSFILYKKPKAQKYYQFDIPKRTGGSRKISAPYPDLKNLQSRLSDLLQDCITEINAARGISSTLSHGFRRRQSIMTNAAVHRRKRYVFNADLEDFFGAINFGRVRGFFIKNQNFGLDPAVATILAQIACHENVLPQGSPCSPVISNLIAHVLDIRLAKLAYDTGCYYSRYADDLTFSTNKSNFPTNVASQIDQGTHCWEAGQELQKIVQKTGFAINSTKTRMQLKDSRQEVTGLVVNRKVNTRAEYRHIARAMTYRLLQTGKFQTKQSSTDADGHVVVQEADGSLDQLNGMLSFIDAVARHGDSRASGRSATRVVKKQKLTISSIDNTYRRFLFYRNFYAAPRPVIVCEGKTDIVYLREAIKRNAARFTELIKADAQTFEVTFFRSSRTTNRLLGLGGGAGGLKNLIIPYNERCGKIAAPGLDHPVILLIDNDAGANSIYSAIKAVTGDAKPDGSEAFYHVCQNLYVVPTPLCADGADTMIEDFFEPKLKMTKIAGKKFNLATKKDGFDSKTEYGKVVFAEQVVKKQKLTINFDGFIPILETIRNVIAVHAGDKQPN